MKKDLIPVKGHTHLARDRKTGVIVNINTTEIQQARQRKEFRKNKNKELDELKDQVHNLTLLVADLAKAVKKE